MGIATGLASELARMAHVCPSVGLGTRISQPKPKESVLKVTRAAALSQDSHSAVGLLPIGSSCTEGILSVNQCG